MKFERLAGGHLGPLGIIHQPDYFSFSKHSSSLLMSPVSPTFSFPLLSMFLFSFSLKFGVS